MPAYFKNDKLIITSDGDLIDFDPEVIDRAIKEVRERKSFFEKHCLPLGKNHCAVCQMAACPIADQ